jgi:hydrogenase maturation protease
MMLKVIGLGNSLRGDDGIGPEVIRILQRDHATEFKEVIDAGSDAWTVLLTLMENHPVLVIDCARMGLDPGSIRRWSAGDERFDLAAHGLSLHGFNLADVWQMARAMGVRHAPVIIGVQPETLEFNSGLSVPVRDSLPAVVHMVREEAKKYEL